ncbi:MAG: carboxypeptidase-like regulatory domain-containing protein [Ignavibacteriota bacterium]
MPSPKSPPWKGTVTGVDGKPAVGAGRQNPPYRYQVGCQLKTDKKGHYIHTGVPLGTFEISVLVDGKELDRVNGVKSQMGDHPPTDFDLRKDGREHPKQAGDGGTGDGNRSGVG